MKVWLQNKRKIESYVTFTANYL